MTITELMVKSHNMAIDKGFWSVFDDGEIISRNNSELLMLIVTEIAEACEALRHDNPKSDHIPEFSFVEEELADAMIRICDMAKANKYRLEEAIEAKLIFNATRPYMHGGKKF
jgi:NTP pyrophosphatase (non-canonical NTP hydrolase)